MLPSASECCLTSSKPVTGMSSNSDSYLLKMGVGEVGDVSDSVNMTGMTFLGTATRLTVQTINPPILLGISNHEIKL